MIHNARKPACRKAANVFKFRATGKKNHIAIHDVPLARLHHEKQQCRLRSVKMIPDGVARNRDVLHARSGARCFGEVHWLAGPRHIFFPVDDALNKRLELLVAAQRHALFEIIVCFDVFKLMLLAESRSGGNAGDALQDFILRFERLFRPLPHLVRNIVGIRADEK